MAVSSVQSLCFVITLFFISGTTAVDWGDLRCTFSAFDYFHIDSFFQLPRTFSAAKSQGWQKPAETVHEKNLTTLCEKNDARICLLYDGIGSLAGYQVAIPRVVDSLHMLGIDYEKKGFTSATLFGEQWYIARIFFESPDMISKGGRTWNGQTGLGLWIPIGGKLQEIPIHDKDIAAKIPMYKRQNCYGKMGVHYFYNLSRSMTPEEYQPFFLLYSTGGELIGWGVNAFGFNAVKSKPFREYVPFFKKRNWFETVFSSKVRNVAPDTPDWALDYLEQYGSYSHHVYMVSKPWNISC